MAKDKESSDSKSQKRHFQYITGDGKAIGRYSGVKPKQAANKVYSALWRERKTKGKPTTGEIRFAIRECTRGSRRKTYYYVGVREKLKKPTEVKIQSGGGDEKTVLYKYSNKVMKDKAATDKAKERAEKEEKEAKKKGKGAKKVKKAGGAKKKVAKAGGSAKAGKGAKQKAGNKGKPVGKPAKAKAAGKPAKAAKAGAKPAKKAVAAKPKAKAAAKGK
jgi:hypothetical protein